MRPSDNGWPKQTRARQERTIGQQDRTWDTPWNRGCPVFKKNRNRLCCQIFHIIIIYNLLQSIPELFSLAGGLGKKLSNKNVLKTKFSKIPLLSRKLLILIFIRKVLSFGENFTFLLSIQLLPKVTSLFNLNVPLMEKSVKSKSMCLSVQRILLNQVPGKKVFNNKTFKFGCYLWVNSVDFSSILLGPWTEPNVFKDPPNLVTSRV